MLSLRQQYATEPVGEQQKPSQIAAAATVSKTTVTELFGVGPIVAATVIGDVGDIARFRSRDHFAAYNGTAPIERSSGGRRKVFRACSVARQPAPQPRHPYGCGHPDPSSPQSWACRRRAQDCRRKVWQGSDPGAQTADQRRHLHPSPRRRGAGAARVTSTGPGGHRATTRKPAWPAHTPNTGSSVKPPQTRHHPTTPPAHASASRGRTYPSPAIRKTA